jgi:pyridoxamine-phosphate oxidase
MDFQAIRKEYIDRGIEIDDLDPCPIQQLSVWMQEAAEARPGDWYESNAMSLATADAAGIVTVRIVLLKGIDGEGIRFFTNYDSCKARQLASNPHCAVALHWPYVDRQIRIVGTAEKTSREVSEAYFRQRPRGSQVSAAVSNQSFPIGSRAELELAVNELESRLGGSEVPLPDNWGGYLLRPTEFEFWQGRPNRLHDRVAYVLDASNGSWSRETLAP